MGEQTLTTLELNCPGCGAFFRLKPKRGKLPKGPIPCPKCSSQIPIPAPKASTSNQSDESTGQNEKFNAKEPPKSQIMGRGIIKRKRRGGTNTSIKPPSPDAKLSDSTADSDEVKQPISSSDSHPLDIFEQAMASQMGKRNQKDTSSTFLGLPTLDNSTPGVFKPDSAPKKEPEISTQEMESGQAPENSKAPWNDPFKAKSEDFTREQTVVDDHAVIDQLRQIRNTAELETVHEDMRDTKDLQPVDSQKSLRDTEEFDPVKPNRQTPISMEKLDKLFDDEQNNQQAKVKPQDVSWKDDAAGPFDLRDILAAEKQLGNDISGEITRNPALDESIYPMQDKAKAKPLPDDSFGSNIQRPKSSQLSKLTLSNNKSQTNLLETSDRSNSGAFQSARVSTGDIFSESSAVLNTDDSSRTDDSIFPLPSNEPKPVPDFGLSSKTKDAEYQQVEKSQEKEPAPSLAFDLDVPESPAVESNNLVELGSEDPSEAKKPLAQDDVDSKKALSNLLKKKVNKHKLAKLRTNLEKSEASEANATSHSSPTLEQTGSATTSATDLILPVQSPSDRETDEFDAQNLAKISENWESEKEQATIEIQNVDDIIVSIESANIGNSQEDKGIINRARRTITGQHISLNIEDEDADLYHRPPSSPRLSQSKSDIAVTAKPKLPPLPDPPPRRTMAGIPIISRTEELPSNSNLDATFESDEPLDLEKFQLGSPSEENLFPESTASSPSTISAPSEMTDEEDPRNKSGIPLISGFPSPSSKSTEDLKIIRSKRRKGGESQSGLFARPIAQSLGQESSVTLGMAGERRGSGYIRLPTTEILEVLGEGAYKLMVEDIIYEPVDEQGLTSLIKQGVLLGAEQIANQNGDWMPIAEHPVFRRLRRKMAIEAHALLAKYKRAEGAPDAALDQPKFSRTRPLHAIAPSVEQDPYGPSEVQDDEAVESIETHADADQASISQEDVSEPIELVESVESVEASEDESPIESFEDKEISEVSEPVDASVSDEKIVVEESTEQTPDEIPPTEVVKKEDEEIKVSNTEPMETLKATPEASRPKTDRSVEKVLVQESQPTQKPKRSSVPIVIIALLLTAITVVAAKPQWFGLQTMFGDKKEKPIAKKVDNKLPLKTDDKVVTKKKVETKVEPPQPKKSVLEQAMDLDKSGNHAGAVALLKPLYQEKPDDLQQAILYAKTLTKANMNGQARKVALMAMVNEKIDAATKERLESIYKQSIVNDPALTQTKAKQLLKGDDLDTVVYQSDQKKYLFFYIKKGDKTKYIFKPAQVEWGDRWRGEVAAWRLCQMLSCAFVVPKTIPAKIKKSDLIAMLGGSDTDRKAGLRRIENDELDVTKEKDGTSYIYGALQEYVEEAAPFPIEYKALWAAMINVTEEEKELKRTITDVLSIFKRVGSGKYNKAIEAQTGKMTTTSLITQVSSLLVFDYLLNHRPRFAKSSSKYGESTKIYNGHLYSIDHGMSWPRRASSTVRTRYRYASRFSQSMITALRLLDPKFANDVLFPDPSKSESKQLNIFWKQRKSALRGVGNLEEKYTKESVLFFP